MRKATTQHHGFAGHATRLVAAASLAVSLAAFGCTTDRTGAGEPQRYGPATTPTAPRSTATPGSEGTAVNPPMISSYSAGSVMPRHVDTDALAIAAANQSFRGRVLGPANPGGVAGSAAEMGPTGQFISPTYAANPEITVNSSISSQPTPVITSGGVVAADSVFIGGTGVIATPQAATPGTAAAITNGTVGTTMTSNTAALTNSMPAGANVNPAIAGTVVGSPTPLIGSTALVTPTSAAAAGGLTNGQFAAGPGVTTVAPATAPARITSGAAIINNNGGTLTPTVASGATLNPTLASNPVSTATTAPNAATATATMSRTRAARTSASRAATAASSSPLIIGRAANGTVTVTNLRTVGDRLVVVPPANNNLNNLRLGVRP